MITNAALFRIGGDSSQLSYQVPATDLFVIQTRLEHPQSETPFQRGIGPRDRPVESGRARGQLHYWKWCIWTALGSCEPARAR